MYFQYLDASILPNCPKGGNGEVVPRTITVIWMRALPILLPVGAVRGFQPNKEMAMYSKPEWCTKAHADDAPPIFVVVVIILGCTLEAAYTCFCFLLMVHTAVIMHWERELLLVWWMGASSQAVFCLLSIEVASLIHANWSAFLHPLIYIFNSK